MLKPILHVNLLSELETDDYVRMFSVVHSIQSVDLRNVGQFKDGVVDFVLERDIPIIHLRLDAANLVSDHKWREYFSRCGHRLESLKLSWLENSMDDDGFVHLVSHCPGLRRIKLRKCFKLGATALAALSKLSHLEHLSLRGLTAPSSTALAGLIAAVGPRLRTLSLQDFSDIDDDVLATIRSFCSNLTKLKLTGNDVCTDAGFRRLFFDSANPPLSFIDLSSNRSVDYATPDGPDDPIGLASGGFEALMEHSGPALEHLNISSCRHISYNSLATAFDGSKRYPQLSIIDVSFLTKIDTAVFASMFKSCPLLTKVAAFGCFNAIGVSVPQGVAVIGLPDVRTVELNASHAYSLWILIDFRERLICQIL